jgi:hypothetical protein
MNKLNFFIEGNFFVLENKKAANSWFNTIAKIGEILDKEQDYLNLEFQKKFVEEMKKNRKTKDNRFQQESFH